ncbi:hypothetical protein FKW77_009903 [Venturia effusa]|uniref:Uncharacterized protein n=1 Tax=Venturia effusa TaxID=50376 RepID=A0A517L491_9PEZI|nr:hypothetical protein FKW77_009903 [Venturia effusa]
MAIDNPFPNHYGSVMLSPLTFPSGQEPDQLAFPANSTNKDLGPSSYSTVSGDEEQTVEDVASALGLAELKDVPPHRSFVEERLSRPVDDVLLHRESEQKLRLARARDSLNDDLLLQQRKPSKPSRDISQSPHHEQCPASSTSTQHVGLYDEPSRLPTLDLPPEPGPRVAMYQVSWEYRVEVTSFLIEHIGASQSLTPSFLLIIDVDTPEIKGSVITSLARTAHSLHRVRGSDVLLHTGESILVPGLHDPRGMVQCLLERGGIKPASIRPHVSSPSATEQTPTTHDHRLSASLVDEARLFALRNKRKPTMAKFWPERNELVWCGWNLLLNPDGKSKTNKPEMRNKFRSDRHRNWNLEVEI